MSDTPGLPGSYSRVTSEEGALRTEDWFRRNITGKDAYETIEDMYGMIWWLADALAHEEAINNKRSVIVESRVAFWTFSAQANVNHGLNLSPAVRFKEEPVKTRIYIFREGTFANSSMVDVTWGDSPVPLEVREIDGSVRVVGTVTNFSAREDGWITGVIDVPFISDDLDIVTHFSLRDAELQDVVTGYIKQSKQVIKGARIQSVQLRKKL